jgi:hypothetical protein
VVAVAALSLLVVHHTFLFAIAAVVVVAAVVVIAVAVVVSLLIIFHMPQRPSGTLTASTPRRDTSLASALQVVAMTIKLLPAFAWRNKAVIRH